ncbi:hypothetical protein FBU31_007496, partial [Coemansia sp. 'formosensis']
MAGADKKRGNDNGFVFTRVRTSTKAAMGQATIGSNNENKPVVIHSVDELAGNKRQASSEASPKLEFPEPKRRVAAPAPAVQELSVPVRKAPQPTPLISRTRTRAMQPPPTTPSANGRQRRATAAAAATESTGTPRMRPVARAGTRKSTMGARRRSTFSMRGKRASSIGGGFKATPHDSVSAGDFYRHISPELPEPIRLRQLLAWCARRTASNASQGGWPVELPPGVRRVLGDALREAVDDMHSAFEKGAIATS